MLRARLRVLMAKRKRYFGLRPRRAIRRWLVVGIAVVLLGVIAAEAVWLLRNAPA